MPKALNILRYDRLYSSNEAVILFAGTQKSADSLDKKIQYLNGRYTRYHFRDLTTKPRISPIEVDLQTLDAIEQLEGNVMKAYGLDLSEIRGSHQGVAFDTMASELGSYARKRKFNAAHDLPVAFRADNLTHGEELLHVRREELKTIYEGKPGDRMEEIMTYLQSLVYMITNPKGIFILSRENK